MLSKNKQVEFVNELFPGIGNSGEQQSFSSSSENSGEQQSGVARVHKRLLHLFRRHCLSKNQLIQAIEYFQEGSLRIDVWLILSKNGQVEFVNELFPEG
ncbi:hypothetical protein SOVF_154550 [Spinacia oleracea]|nr:hypothetical protein SOVF_154550 [Spinacia oleracea]